MKATSARWQPPTAEIPRMQTLKKRPPGLTSLAKRSGFWGQNLRKFHPKPSQSDLGRFISADPIGFAGGLNQYAYSSNNPVGRVDPSGTFPWPTPGELLFIGVGSVAAFAGILASEYYAALSFQVPQSEIDLAVASVLPEYQVEVRGILNKYRDEFKNVTSPLCGDAAQNLYYKLEYANKSKNVNVILDKSSPAPPGYGSAINTVDLLVGKPNNQFRISLYAGSDLVLGGKSIHLGDWRNHEILWKSPRQKRQ